jgi:hypothetical protein
MEAWYGMFMDAVGARCCPWIASTRRTDRGTGKCTSIKLGEVGALGVLTITKGALVSCSTTQVVKKIIVKYGSYIDSLQFVCDEYNQ